MNKGDFKMIIEIIDETEVVPESHQELVHKVVSFAADFLKNVVFLSYLVNGFEKSIVISEISIK